MFKGIAHANFVKKISISVNIKLKLLYLLKDVSSIKSADQVSSLYSKIILF